ncbi:hypothetical protein, partial [Streptomyces rubrogriseus]|uniref:hypothetical protein n=1 Tax=Streptomyces rubrogriseus TaxID=194673 RepID=UPI003810EE4B
YAAAARPRSAPLLAVRGCGPPSLRTPSRRTRLRPALAPHPFSPYAASPPRRPRPQLRAVVAPRRSCA